MNIAELLLKIFSKEELEKINRERKKKVEDIKNLRIGRDANREQRQAGKQKTIS